LASVSAKSQVRLARSAGIVLRGASIWRRSCPLADAHDIEDILLRQCTDARGEMEQHRVRMPSTSIACTSAREEGRRLMSRAPPRRS
jgi:hypothetical protein